MLELFDLPLPSFSQLAGPGCNPSWLPGSGKVLPVISWFPNKKVLSLGTAKLTRTCLSVIGGVKEGCSIESARQTLPPTDCIRSAFIPGDIQNVIFGSN